MKKVSKSVLKAKMFEYFRELEEGGDPIIVTDFGKPVLKIITFKEKKSLNDIFEAVRGKAKISGEAALEGTSDEWIESRVLC